MALMRWYLQWSEAARARCESAAAAGVSHRIKCGECVDVQLFNSLLKNFIADGLLRELQQLF
jgi:hypothetical protein